MERNAKSRSRFAAASLRSHTIRILGRDHDRRKNRAASGMIPLIVSAFVSITASTTSQLPKGTPLHIRLTKAVGSYASTQGSPVSAVLIAPVTVDGKMVLPVGSTLSGTVKAVTRVGLGVRHEKAELDLEFNQITPWVEQPVPISAEVSEVDNARERVTRDGLIHGVRSTNSLCYRVSGYIREALQWEVHAAIATWAIRSLLLQVPEPEIYYPAGVELTLTLTQPLLAASRETAHAVPQITDDERGELTRLVAALPSRTQAPITGRESDLTNVLFLGSHDQIAAAFAAAGWTPASPASLRHRIAWIRAVSERRGDGSGPMSPLLLNGATPDMSWQKGLNDVSKRHHVRMWREPGTWRGQEMWIAAATRDIDFAYLRPGNTFTHRIEQDVDRERDKVAYDLAFTSCGNLLDWTNRADFPRSARNATDDPMITDGRIVAIGLNDCSEPRLSTESADATPVAEHGGGLQRFTRREILSARNDLLRTNRYWRAYEGSRWIVESILRRKHPALGQESLIDAPTSRLGQFARLAASRLQ